MSIKAFFKGKTSKFFWVNVALMVTLLIAVPVIAFYMLDSFTHHGEKIEVPSVIGKTVREASSQGPTAGSRRQRLHLQQVCHARLRSRPDTQSRI